MDRDPGDEDEGAAEATEAIVGFPVFEHNQWTIEGEIERFGAFGRGAAHARGWRRKVAVLLVVAMIAPLVIGTVNLLRGATHHEDSVVTVRGHVANATCEDVRADPYFAASTTVAASNLVGTHLQCYLGLLPASPLAGQLGVTANCPPLALPVDLDVRTHQWRFAPALTAGLTDCTAR